MGPFTTSGAFSVSAADRANNETLGNPCFLLASATIRYSSSDTRKLITLDLRASDMTVNHFQGELSRSQTGPRWTLCATASWGRLRCSPDGRVSARAGFAHFAHIRFF